MTDCPNCEYHKQRAARWRAEAYKQAGHDVIELPWVGLTDEEIQMCYETTGHCQTLRPQDKFAVFALARAIEAKLKEKNA